MKKLYLNSINAAITFYKSYKRIFLMFSKKNYIKEISIYSYKSQNLTEFSSNNMSITLLSNFRTNKKPQQKKCSQEICWHF